MSEPPGHAYHPSPSALRWVAESVGAGATVRSVSPLAGATSSVLHGIEIEYRGRRVELVMRQFVNAEWVRDEPDLAFHEAASLIRAARADVPTPELIAYDEWGDRCGVPATLMTRLPGSVELQPESFDGWLHGLAAAIASAHIIDAEDFPWNYSPYCDISRLEPPSWSGLRKEWEKALEIVAGQWPPAHARFIHRDYHPNNVVWHDGRVSGIVDWVNACRGPQGIDVAWCRQNLAQMYGVAQADMFLTAYRTVAGAGFEYHPFWDLVAAMELLPEPGVYAGWVAFGLRGLDEEVIKRRVDDYVASIMARF